MLEMTAPSADRSVDCAHHWQYFVDMRSRMVRIKRCADCSAEQTLARRQETPTLPAA